MTATIEKNLPAALPVVATSPSPHAPALREAAAEPPGREGGQAPTKAAERRHERALLWAKIEEAGGAGKWIEAELAARGLRDTTDDPSKLSDKEKAAYKERKKNEARERKGLERAAWEAFHATHIAHLGSGVHWEEAAGADRFDVDGREERAKQLGLDGPSISGVTELAKALGMTIPVLRWMAFHREVDTGSHYRRWTIPKRDGSARTITSPKRRLKAAQRWALRNVFERLPVHGSAHGFLASRSIVSNALPHAGADVVVKVDIKDFFPTIGWKRVKGLLRKGGVPERVATLLALLSTEAPREVVQFRGKTLYVAQGPRALPQGAPTSPAITNALCMRLDRRMSGLSRVFGFRYTRYADDLTFSWRAPADASSGAPAAVVGTNGGKTAAKARDRAAVGGLLRGVKRILDTEGFQIHPSKTRVMRAGSRQVVTGLVVNASAQGGAEARVPREMRRQLRAALHNREKGKPGKVGESLAQLKGLAAFVHMTDPKEGRALLDRVAALEARANLGGG